MRAAPLLPGCLCNSSPVQPDCGCRLGGGPGPHYSMDATPMLHRLPAVWRMRATLPRPAALKFVVMVRRPEERAISHYRMLVKLSARGEEWAQAYVANQDLDTKLRREAAAFAQCAAAYAASSGADGAARLPAKAWYDCVGVACGFHLCVVGQSIYAPQLKGWLDRFGSRQFLALTLDEFAAAPRVVLPRVAAFLGVASFPRLVLNWNWQWNQLGQDGGDGGGGGAASAQAQGRQAARRAAPPVQEELRVFYEPYNAALAALLRRRGQPHAAQYVEGWARRNGTV